jgi:hypothetical protein
MSTPPALHTKLPRTSSAAGNHRSRIEQALIEQSGSALRLLRLALI